MRRKIDLLIEKYENLILSFDKLQYLIKEGKQNEQSNIPIQEEINKLSWDIRDFSVSIVQLDHANNCSKEEKNVIQDLYSYLAKGLNNKYLNLDILISKLLTLKRINDSEVVSEIKSIPNKLNNKYDFCLSFAGENREYVEKVAIKLIDFGVNVFYDKYEQSNLWGKDLYQHLNDVYKNKSKYCIVFISEYYEKKLWTNHELRSAQARAFSENIEYILPVKLDNTLLPGINDTIGYICGINNSPIQIAKLAYNKLIQE